ncbi:Uncharacterized protein FWK35_00005512 [Aphis craccivora]|uniref:Uncharacterized protein n=1 Tax=Aphis craccivora TaxID=307492 RepID=A0A6G0Z2Q6_APHCR|nr:Uncharacterized protein FWK35_00005512 [Aphis craccivora]
MKRNDVIDWICLLFNAESSEDVEIWFKIFSVILLSPYRTVETKYAISTMKDKCVPFLALWTPIMNNKVNNGIEIRQSNATVESWFKTVKISILEGDRSYEYLKFGVTIVSVAPITNVYLTKKPKLSNSIEQILIKLDEALLPTKTAFENIPNLKIDFDQLKHIIENTLSVQNSTSVLTPFNISSMEMIEILETVRPKIKSIYSCFDLDQFVIIVIPLILKNATYVKGGAMMLLTVYLISEQRPELLRLLLVMQLKPARRVREMLVSANAVERGIFKSSTH